MRSRQDLLAVLDALARRPGFRPQLEVAVDTWDVLEGNERPAGDDGLASAIAAELSWIEAQLQRRAQLV